MVEMISEREQLTQQYEKQIVQLKAERDSNFHHLTSLETTFSDLHVWVHKLNAFLDDSLSDWILNFVFKFAVNTKKVNS